MKIISSCLIIVICCNFSYQGIVYAGRHNSLHKQFSKVLGDEDLEKFYELSQQIPPNFDFNSQSKNTRTTLLHKAVRCVHFFGVMFLLEHGALPIIQDVHGRTPLHDAVIRIAFNNKMRLSELEQCPCEQYTRLITALSAVNDQNNSALIIADAQGNIPLHYAIKFNDEFLVRLLSDLMTKSGFSHSFNVQNESMRTPTYYNMEAHSDAANIQTILQENGANTF